jgi:hypothetical protein
MGASGSNCNHERKDEMTKDLSRNRAYCAAREAGCKPGFVRRTEEAWMRARAQNAQLRDDWVLVEGDWTR